jgi:hypothetical protein
MNPLPLCVIKVTKCSHIHDDTPAGLPSDFAARDSRSPAKPTCIVEQLCAKHQGKKTVNPKNYL